MWSQRTLSKVQPGDVIKAEDWNALIDQINAASTMGVDTGTEISINSTGRHFRVLPDVGFWAQLTNIEYPSAATPVSNDPLLFRHAKYMWRRVKEKFNDGGAGLYEGRWEDSSTEDGFVDTDAHWPAYEIHDWFAPLGSVVWLRQAVTGKHWLFNAPESGIWVRILGRLGTKYSWREQRRAARDTGLPANSVSHQQGGAFVDRTDAEGGRTGTQNAIECNNSSGNFHISQNKKVWLRPFSFDGTNIIEWVFDCGLTDEDPILRYRINPPPAC